jgi:hypothetical protein
MCAVFGEVARCEGIVTHREHFGAEGALVVLRTTFDVAGAPAGVEELPVARGQAEGVPGVAGGGFGWDDARLGVVAEACGRYTLVWCLYKKVNKETHTFTVTTDDDGLNASAAGELFEQPSIAFADGKTALHGTMGCRAAHTVIEEGICVIIDIMM